MNDFVAFDRELLLAKRLVDHGVADVFNGVTTMIERKMLVRDAIILHSLSAVIVGNGKDGKPVTYATAFAATYGEPL